jgi:hypothetical protein
MQPRAGVSTCRVEGHVAITVRNKQNEDDNKIRSFHASALQHAWKTTETPQKPRFQKDRAHRKFDRPQGRKTYQRLTLDRESCCLQPLGECQRGHCQTGNNQLEIRRVSKNRIRAFFASGDTKKVVGPLLEQEAEEERLEFPPNSQPI